MYKRFLADALLSMCKTSFQSNIAHMGDDILEINLKILTLEQWNLDHDCKLC